MRPLELLTPLGTGKRARKISTFMPMRGRKDGRDSRLALANFAAGHDSYIGSGQTTQLGHNEILLPSLNDGEFDVDAPFLRILFDSNGSPTQALASSKNWAPTQFANELRNRQQQLIATSSNNNGINSDEPTTVALVMDAKLRRAFHPMRGKRVSEQATSATISDD